LVGKPEGKRVLGNYILDGRVILKQILKKCGGGAQLDLSGLE
jgi:hypothetical protein